MIFPSPDVTRSPGGQYHLQKKPPLAGQDARFLMSLLGPSLLCPNLYPRLWAKSLVVVTPGVFHHFLSCAHTISSACSGRPYLGPSGQLLLSLLDWALRVLPPLPWNPHSVSVLSCARSSRSGMLTAFST